MAMEHLLVYRQMKPCASNTGSNTRPLLLWLQKHSNTQRTTAAELGRYLYFHCKNSPSGGRRLLKAKVHGRLFELLQ